MNETIKNIKKNIKKVLIISIISFILFSIIASVLIFIRPRWWGLEIIFACLFVILSVLCLFSIVGGTTFLLVNRKTFNINMIKARKALNIGIFYFKSSGKIETALDK